MLSQMDNSVRLWFMRPNKKAETKKNNIQVVWIYKMPSKLVHASILTLIQFTWYKKMFHLV